MAFFRRAIVEASGGQVRWSKNAILALKAIVEARVHRTLALGSTLARVAKKQTLTNVGVLVVPPHTAHHSHVPPSSAGAFGRRIGNHQGVGGDLV